MKSRNDEFSNQSVYSRAVEKLQSLHATVTTLTIDSQPLTLVELTMAVKA